VQDAGIRPKPCQVKAGRRKSENAIPGQDWLAVSDGTDAADGDAEYQPQI
jgi:hypothetical protein